MTTKPTLTPQQESAQQKQAIARMKRGSRRRQTLKATHHDRN
jgi:hypothetical protein